MDNNDNKPDKQDQTATNKPKQPVPPCSGHAYQPENDCVVYCGCVCGVNDKPHCK